MTTAPSPNHTALVACAAIAGYVLACALQNLLIAQKVGLDLSFWDVLKSTVKLMVTAGPWVPFLMQPPTD